MRIKVTVEFDINEGNNAYLYLREKMIEYTAAIVIDHAESHRACELVYLGCVLQDTIKGGK